MKEFLDLYPDHGPDAGTGPRSRAIWKDRTDGITKWRITVRRGDEHISEVTDTAGEFVPHIAPEHLIERMPPILGESYSLTIEKIR